MMMAVWMVCGHTLGGIWLLRGRHTEGRTSCTANVGVRVRAMCAQQECPDAESEAEETWFRGKSR